MRDILQDIVATKIVEVANQKANTPLAQLESQVAEYSRVPISMKESLMASKSGIIAEFKRKSPSKGWINQDAICSQIIDGYYQSNAAAASVLIDQSYFGGGQEYMRQARVAAPNLALLYKEFIVDEYQILEAKLAGADAVLLIAAVLSPQECDKLALYAKSLGLETLLEIHSHSEIELLTANIDMLGVNNRNLGSFDTNVALSFELAPQLLRYCESQSLSPLLVSESGIYDPSVVAQLRQAGYKGFLIGENFMRTASPAATLQEFITKIEELC